MTRSIDIQYIHMCKHLKLLWRVQHVLHCQVTAALQTAVTEFTDELQVVQAVCYRHGLLHANILHKKVKH